MTIPVPKEVIVVEGRDDTKRLIETFGPTVKTIETGGSALTDQTLQQIIKAEQAYGVIILTDPDFQGQRLRRLVTKAVPEAKQAHLTQDQAYGGGRKSLGVEHATPAVLRQALSQVMTPLGECQASPPIPLSQLAAWGLTAGPEAKRRRQAVSQHFNLGHTNAKQLQRQFQRYGIDQEQVAAFLETWTIQGGDS